MSSIAHLIPKQSFLEALDMKVDECAQRYLRAGEVAIELGVSERTVRRWIADGSLESLKAGGTRLVAREALEHFIGAPSPISKYQDEGAI